MNLPARNQLLFTVFTAIALLGEFGVHGSELEVDESAGQRHVVEIVGFKFIPETLEVRPGDTVTWVNRDIAPHTATSTDGSWDTGTLKQDESRDIVVSEKMTLSYLCRFHTKMTASIVFVE